MLNTVYAEMHKEPFNGDFNICNEFLKLKNKYNIVNAVETGSCVFSTTEWLGNNFDRVYSFEHNADFFHNFKYKIDSMNHVSVYNSDSIVGLNLIIDEIIDPTIFFLDAHWGDNCPLPHEIDIISRCKAKHVIAIHDFKTHNPIIDGNMCYDHFDGYDLEINAIYKNLINIYPDGIKFYYNHDVAGAKRGMIYILPD